MVEMRVQGLAVDPQSKERVVILTDMNEIRFLPIWIGVYESEAILLALENIKVPRPTTHDLMKSVALNLGATLERIVIHTVDDMTATYYAKLVLVKEGSLEPLVEVDARPSDAIALALRFQAPIFVTEAILSQPDVAMDKEKVNKDIAEFKKFLADVKPSDFDRYDRAHGEKPRDDSDGEAK